MPHTPRNIQSGYDADDFWDNWNSTTPRIALFVKIIPQGYFSAHDTIGLTSNTRDVVLPGHSGIVFKSAPAIMPTLVEQTLREPSNMEFTGVYSTGIFERTDVIAGKWDGAIVEIFSCSWDSTRKNYGELVWDKYNLADFKDNEIQFTAEVRGQLQKMSVDSGAVTQKFCRVKDFGNTRCGVDLNGTVEISTIDYNIRQVNKTGAPGLGGGNTRIVFDISTFDGNLPTDFGELDAYILAFKNGKITATSGDNEGVSREIASGISEGSFPSMALYLKRKFPFVPMIGDTYTITMGCVRTLENCRFYLNAANFDGEAFIPTVESANSVN